MSSFALNHMTAARASYGELLGLAQRVGCVGIEVRNDLPGPLFDGMPPAGAGAMARDHGLRLLSVAEVKRFDDWNADKAREARALVAIAAQAGAEAISLIPRTDKDGLDPDEHDAQLRQALGALRPMLSDAGLIGLVEPLGFDTCALRYKRQVVEAIDALGARATFRLVHDTFHHHLADETEFFADHTGLVHISGVVDPAPERHEMRDAHRVLVDKDDRLGNIAQLGALMQAGYRGPISLECFAPSVHGLDDPMTAIGSCMEFIRTHMAARAA